MRKRLFQSRQLPQGVEQGSIGGVGTARGLFQREPLRPVDFRKAPDPSGMRRPFHLEGIGVDRIRIQVALQGPDEDELAAFQPYRGQRRGPPGWRLVSGLLAEFTQGGMERVLPLGDFALGNGPASGVAVLPVGTAG